MIYLWCGRTVGWAVGVRSRDYQIFSDRQITTFSYPWFFARESSAINLNWSAKKSTLMQGLKKFKLDPRFVCPGQLHACLCLVLARTTCLGPFQDLRQLSMKIVTCPEGKTNLLVLHQQMKLFSSPQRFKKSRKQ